MSDERRAEIEAVRPFIVGALREARAAISATPVATRENARALRLVDDALGRLDRVRDARGDDEGREFTLNKRELDVLCESLWHSLARADLPGEDIDVMRPLRERLNDARR